MSDFDISIDYKGEQRTYHGELVTYGYSYKIVLQIGDIPVTFEPDEERQFRALVPPEHLNEIDVDVLKLLSEELETTLK